MSKTRQPCEKDLEMLIPEDASKLLQIDAKTMAAWRCRQEGPPYVKLGGLVRYRRKDLLAWVHENLVQTGQRD